MRWALRGSTVLVSYASLAKPQKRENRTVSALYFAGKPFTTPNASTCPCSPLHKRVGPLAAQGAKSLACAPTERDLRRHPPAGRDVVQWRAGWRACRAGWESCRAPASRSGAAAAARRSSSPRPRLLAWLHPGACWGRQGRLCCSKLQQWRRRSSRRGRTAHRRRANFRSRVGSSRSSKNSNRHRISRLSSCLSCRGQRERRPPQPRSSRRQQGQQRWQQQQERSSAEEEEEQEQQLPQRQGTRYIGVRRSSREGKPTYTMVLADVPNAQDLLERWQFEFPSAVSRWRLWEECVGLFSRRVSYMKGRRLDSARRQAGWQAALPDRVLRHRAAVMQTSAVGCSFKLAWQVAFQGAPH